MKVLETCFLDFAQKPAARSAALALVWRGRLGLAGTLARLPTGVTCLHWIVAIVMIATDPD